MPFIYDCDFTVHSVIDNLDDVGMPDGEPEISITTVRGFLKAEAGESSDRLFISYSEDGEGGRTHTDLALDGGRVKLSRRGAASYDLVFSEGEECSTIYSVPPYSFDMRVLCKKIRSSMTRGGGELQIIYSMTVGGAEKTCRLKITAKRR